jgi:galactonate dehydratase
LTRRGPITAIDAWGARVSPKTEWILVRIADADGVVGWGEATLTGQEAAVLEAVRRIGDGLVGEAPEPGTLRASSGDALPVWAAASAIDAALWDIAARRAGRSVAATLGGERRNAVAVYANINRRTIDRSPAGFAASARAALAAGHTRLKLAPFDGLTPALCDRGDGGDLIAAGLARIAAVREAGPAAAVMVDCHWRFSPAAVPDLIEALAALRVNWLECPIPEDGDAPATLARLRSRTQRQDMKLAGCETQTAESAFDLFLDAGAYDAIMPDVKYVGALDAMLRIAARARKAGAECAPHNPSGPIAHAASLHACAAMESFLFLEMQFDETPHFDALVGGALPQAAVGAIRVGRDPGLGVAIDEAALARLASAIATLAALP